MEFAASEKTDTAGLATLASSRSMEEKPSVPKQRDMARKGLGVHGVEAQ